MTAKTDIVRACFDAYRRKDKRALEDLFADDFTFTSPYDDAISKTDYFVRCWPVSSDDNVIRENVVERICEGAGGVYASYRCVLSDGKEFRNTEFFAVEDGKVKSVEVYFGASYRNGAFFRKE